MKNFSSGTTPNTSSVVAAAMAARSALVTSFGKCPRGPALSRVLHRQMQPRHVQAITVRPASAPPRVALAVADGGDSDFSEDELRPQAAAESSESHYYESASTEGWDALTAVAGKRDWRERLVHEYCANAPPVSGNVEHEEALAT